MKVFIVLTALLASTLAEELIFNRNSNANSQQPSRIGPVPMQSGQGTHQSERSLNNRMREDSNERLPSSRRNVLSGRASQDPNALSPDMLAELFQQAQQQQSGTPNSNVESSSSIGYWATYPDAAAFDAKIQARLSSSRTLADKPEIRRKIIQIAEEKYNQCKGLVDDRERACLGRITGQVMQLASAVENMSRNPQ